MPGEDITRLLLQSREGNADANNRLLPLVYRELRRIADGHLRRQTPGHTLQPTELIHEAWVKLVAAEQPEWKDRLHFFAFTATIMRNILVDHARTKTAEKRGGGAPTISLTEALAYAPDRPADIVALDEALRHLAEFDERKARILELRFFAGLDIKETAEALALSVPTVVRETRFAQAWLRKQLSSPPGNTSATN